MLHIHTSNRLEYLAQDCATIIKENPQPPLIREIIVVQNQGMARWLSMSLAEELGVFAHGHFLFPDALLRKVFKAVLDLPDISQFERDVMLWSLMEILPKFFENQEFMEINAYLQDDEQEIKRFQLAWRLANVFDQYVVYRPDWIADWENEKQPESLKNDSQARWQAILWRALIARFGTAHRAKLRAAFFSKAENLANKSQFKRISVFGISALPLFHLDVLAKLGEVVQVHIFLLNPCKEYWGRIVSDGEMAYQTGNQSIAPETLYFEKGNTLLASLGRMGRDFIDMLNEYPHVNHDYFDEPGEETLLACLQSDILHLKERGTPTPIDFDDKSLQIHICHSPMREVEVLHDQLLALFEENPKLLPKDVIVMMPDIETYAPLIEAVFATAQRAKKIPFSIADRNLRGESALVNTFFAILELSKSRFSVSEVLGVLETEAVQKRFGLSEQDLDLIRHWIEKTGIRWGMNKADRVHKNLPAFEENTWWAGLKRLLLGYALPGGGEKMFNEILPYDGIEGSDALILGKLVTFVEKLFESVQALAKPRILSEWLKFLTQILEDFLEENENNQAQEIRKVLKDLVEKSQKAGFDAPVSYEVMLEYLRVPLAQKEQPSHFMTGNVSFCTLLPMRSIPFKVVCLLGMNDQDFPRPNKPLSFDLIAKKHKRGDRSRRQNDRYLFLESLLSARESFYISYVGQSQHDNTIMPPSVLVSELLDYVGKAFSHPQQKILNLIMTHHPLQAFSPRYFNQSDKQLFSFSHEYCRASAVLLNERQTSKNFFETPLPAPQTEWKTVELNQLTRFFKNPIEFLLKERLGIALERGESQIDESEPFEVQGLERYNLNQMLVEKNLEGVDLQEYQAIVKAGGQLPHGEIGDYVYSQLTTQVQPFVDRVKLILRQHKIESVPVNLTIGEMRITGHLSQLWRDSLVHYRCAKLKARDYVQLWIHHLILNSLSQKNLPSYSVLIGENEAWEFQPVKNSLEILQILLNDYYWQGVVQPLSFFPDSSFTFVENLNKGKTEEEAFSRAKNSWQGNDFMRGEAEGDYYQLCFGNEELPLDNEEFKPLAKQFFEQFFEFRQPLSA